MIEVFYAQMVRGKASEALGCGASVLTLHRTAAGPFAIEDSVTLEQIEAAVEAGNADELLMAPELALPAWPSLTVNGDMAYYLGRGQPVMVPRAPPSGWVKLFGPAERFLGVGAINDEGMVAPKRLLAR